MFTDATITTSPDVIDTQPELNTLWEYCKDRDLQVNVTHTEVIVYRKFSERRLKYNDNEPEMVKRYVSRC